MRIGWILVAILAWRASRPAQVIVLPPMPAPPAVAAKPVFHVKGQVIPCTCNNPCGWCGGGSRWMVVDGDDNAW